MTLRPIERDKVMQVYSAVHPQRARLEFRGVSYFRFSSPASHANVHREHSTTLVSFFVVIQSSYVETPAGLCWDRMSSRPGYDQTRCRTSDRASESHVWRCTLGDGVRAFTFLVSSSPSRLGLLVCTRGEQSSSLSR